MKYIVVLAISLVLFAGCKQRSDTSDTSGLPVAKEQGIVSEKHKVRLSRIVVDPTRLEEYNAFLKEEIEASMRLEPEVLTLYATAEKMHPNRIAILEIYAHEQAYQSHIKTPHFQKYKEGTLDMVQELELIDAIPLIEGLKIKSEKK